MTSTHRVAERAGVPQPHLYASFRSKRELYAVCAERVRARACEVTIGAPFRDSTANSPGDSLQFDGGVVGAFLLQAVAGSGDGETGQLSRELLDAIEQHHGTAALESAIQRGFAYLRAMPTASA